MFGLIKVMFNYAVEEEYISEQDNPVRKIKKLKEVKTIIISFNDEEVKKILDSCNGNTYSNIRDKLILMMLFDLGIRVSELTNLRPKNVKESHILIKGKGDKERFLYVSPILKRQIMKFNNAKKQRFSHKKEYELEEYFFLNQCGKQLSRSRINKILNEHAKIANVREEIRVSPHTCRHYFAHAQLRNGIDVYSLSRLMGHYDTSITSDDLRGLQDNSVLEKGIQSSPLSNL
ncbi:tyrosine-type recombinase/integrase [Vagococcus jeotgali]|uniref:tyrosine-type recombinase/integrase n=1 Tax=Vagococcus jeotgali TaxID=3109030 RepID=UPI002DDA7506|nr:tyrosine-type recombinase/integrase [Vagococcus sp. B2T-5]